MNLTDVVAHDLHSTLIALLDDGPDDLARLTGRARQACPEAEIDEEAVRNVVYTSPVLVGGPDSGCALLIDHLDGQVLTKRVPATTAGRTDLWSNLALHPLLISAIHSPLQLVRGGTLRAADFVHEALVGPPGWLPDVAAGTLIALSVTQRRIDVHPLPEGIDTPPEDEQAVRAALARHYRRESWWDGDDVEERPAELTRAIGHALLEDPQLLARPVSPLDELLYDALQQDRQDHMFLHGSRWAGDESISFSIADMPIALYAELNGRARRYGMSVDHYVIAVLGLAAWRTPFAEDLGSWEDWDLDRIPPDGGDDGQRRRALRSAP